jgi:hypothetical protein
MDTPAIIDIAYAIDNILLSRQLERQTNEEWVGLQIINCIIELSALHNALNTGTKDVFLKVNTDTNTVFLPTDFINWILIGQKGTDDNIYPFDFNDEIPLIKSVSCGIEGYKLKSTEHRFGHIEFNINERDRYIQLRGNTAFNNEIYLKYITSGVQLDRQTIIPLIIVPTLGAYVNWQMAINETRNVKTKATLQNEVREGQIYANYVRGLQQNKFAVSLQDFSRNFYRR